MWGRKIYEELLEIKKELQAIRSSLEHSKEAKVDRDEFIHQIQEHCRGFLKGLKY